MADFLAERLDEVMEVLDAHRWKSMSPSSVECECGEQVFISTATPTLTMFPADREFRKHIAQSIIDRLY